MQNANRLIDKLNNDKNEKVSAIEIKSRADYRKLAPFIDENYNIVIWVNWGHRKETNKKIRPYFRRYTSIRRKTHNLFSKEVQNRTKACNESPVHKKAKETMVTLLKNLVIKNQNVIWTFYDKRNSFFYLKGDLLSEVVAIDHEFYVKTPFYTQYRYDIVLLGEKIHKEPQILGAIELELNHQFEISKTLLCKTLGYPLISIDLTDVKEEEITEEWCYNKLVETTNSSQDNLRKNYIYIHNMLYSIYLQIPKELKHIRKEQNHQYLVFIKDDGFEKLINHLENLKKTLNLNDNDVLIKPIHVKNQQMKRMIKNEGSIAGKNWEDYNKHSYIRIILKFPYQLSGNLYKYHLCLFYLLNSYFDCLVGYKYKKKMTNYDPENKYWTAPVRVGNENITQKIIFKSLSEPVTQIVEFLKDRKIYL